MASIILDNAVIDVAEIGEPISNIEPSDKGALLRNITGAMMYNFAGQIQEEVSALPNESGRASGRSLAAVPVDAPELPKAEESYVRPNGDLYFPRMWGEHQDVAVLRKSRELSAFPLLYGAPGCGKTALAEGAFSDEIESIVGTGDTGVEDLVGGFVPDPSSASGFRWVDGPLLRAAEEGKVFIIDEIGLIDPKVLSVIYPAMDGRGEIIPSANPERGTVKTKPGFFIVGATNPNAPGVRLSEALLSRFDLHVEMTTDWDLCLRLGVPSKMVSFASHCATLWESRQISWSPQMRELLAYKRLSENFGDRFAQQNLLASAPEMDREILAKKMATVMGREILPARI